jgi:hypothetical protein
MTQGEKSYACSEGADNAKTPLLARCFRFLGFGRISLAEDLELSKIAA